MRTTEDFINEFELYDVSCDVVGFVEPKDIDGHLIKGLVNSDTKRQGILKISALSKTKEVIEDVVKKYKIDKRDFEIIYHVVSKFYDNNEQIEHIILNREYIGRNAIIVILYGTCDNPTVKCFITRDKGLW